MTSLLREWTGKTIVEDTGSTKKAARFQAAKRFGGIMTPETGARGIIGRQ
jgi:hypothetical protein